MSRRTFILIVLLASGCTDPVPQIGSPFHPDTDLTQFSDKDLCRCYEWISCIVVHQEKDLARLESEWVGLSKMIAYNKRECRERLEKNKAAEARLHSEIMRRGLNVEFGMPIKEMEPMQSFGLRWEVPGFGPFWAP